MKKVALGILIGLFTLLAQQPTCNRCSATYIGTNEVQAYVKRAIDKNLTDQQIRSVDLGKAQVGIGVVHRGKLLAPGEGLRGGARPD